MGIIKVSDHIETVTMDSVFDRMQGVRAWAGHPRAWRCHERRQACFNSAQSAASGIACTPFPSGNGSRPG